MSGSSSVQTVLDRMMLQQPSGNQDNQSFLPSSTWQGIKEGYYFGTGPQGTGYYLDKGGMEEPTKVPPIKRSVQINETKNEMRLYTPPPSLLEQAETKASGSTIIELTPQGIQSAAHALDKIFQKNALQRAEHDDHPQQYLDSELALHDQLQALTAVAANVELYAYIIHQTTLLETLTHLLGHENDDIAAIVVSLYWEWLDPSLLRNDPELATTIGTLASHVLTEAWEIIVSNFSRFQKQDNNDNYESEQQEYTMSTNDPTLQGIDNSISLMENLLDLDLMIPGGISGSNDLSAAAYMVKETTILSWLLEQVDGRRDNLEFQGRCMELVAFVAQREDVHSIVDDWSQLAKYSSSTTDDQDHKLPPTKKQKTQQHQQEQDQPHKKEYLDGIECMLQIIGQFRKNQPTDETEIGLLENTCLAMTSCITFSSKNLSAFLEGQGVELVVRCLKERVHSGAMALKLLDFVGSDKEHSQACERLVTAGGLKFLFPLFLRTRIPKPAPSYATTIKAKKEWLNTIEAQTIRIFYSLSRHLNDQSPDDAKARFLAKFAQDETKCDRLVELLLYYDEKSRKAEYHFYRSDVEEVVEDEETIQLAALDAKLKGGGDLFHRLGALTAYIAIHSKRCHERILAQLKLQQSGISLVKMALEEFVSLLEEESPQRLQLESYITRI